MKLGIHTNTTNRHFQKALRRINDKVVELQRRLSQIPVEGRFGNLMLTFFDEKPSVYRITSRGKADHIYQIDVGYDFGHRYPPDDDVLVIQLLEEKLKQVIEGDEGFAPKRKELLKLIVDWTTEAIGA
jgi:hypothetical protein